MRDTSGECHRASGCHSLGPVCCSASPAAGKSFALRLSNICVQVSISTAVYQSLCDFEIRAEKKSYLLCPCCPFGDQVCVRWRGWSSRLGVMEQRGSWGKMNIKIIHKNNIHKYT